MPRQATTVRAEASGVHSAERKPRVSHSRDALRPIEPGQNTNVLASGKVASSPSSPSSTAGKASVGNARSSSDGRLRAAAGGSGRSLALRCARRSVAGAGDGQTDASGGGSELRIAPTTTASEQANRFKPTDKTAAARVQSTTRKRAAHAQGADKEVVDLHSQGQKDREAPTRSEAQSQPGVPRRSTVKDTQSSSFVTQVCSNNAAPSTPSLAEGAANVISKLMEADRRGGTFARCIGLDLGKKISYCEVRDGKVVQRATLSKLEDLERLLGPGTEPARVAFEACREAWFYHDYLLSLGHKPMMVDTTRVRKLGIGEHRRKNDRIDAETLARAVESGHIPLAHVLSPERRKLRCDINVRRALVETRAQYVTTLRGILRSWKVQMPTCDTENFVKKFDASMRGRALSCEQYQELEPMVIALRAIDPQIKKMDKKLEQKVQEIEIAKVLMSCPGIGPVAACSYISVIDEAGRFTTAHQVMAYLGLVPSENTSGKRRLGSITKAGNAYLRALLVQAAWNVLKAKGRDPVTLWGRALAKKRGKKIAVVAIARRLAGILWAMWRDGAIYDPAQLSKDCSRGMRKDASRIESTAQAIEASGQKKPASVRKSSGKNSKKAA
jgi:transposase